MKESMVSVGAGGGTGIGTEGGGGGGGQLGGGLMSMTRSPCFGGSNIGASSTHPSSGYVLGVEKLEQNPGQQN